MDQVMNDPAYRGYHVIVVAGKVFKARTGERASEINAGDYLFARRRLYSSPNHTVSFSR